MQGRESIVIMGRFQAIAFFVLQPVRSVAKEMMFWNTAITVDRAANAMKMKNSVPQNRPPAI